MRLIGFWKAKGPDEAGGNPAITCEPGAVAAGRGNRKMDRPRGRPSMWMPCDLNLELVPGRKQSTLVWLGAICPDMAALSAEGTENRNNGLGRACRAAVAAPKVWDVAAPATSRAAVQVGPPSGWRGAGVRPDFRLRIITTVGASKTPSSFACAQVAETRGRGSRVESPTFFTQPGAYQSNRWDEGCEISDLSARTDCLDELEQAPAQIMAGSRAWRFHAELQQSAGQLHAGLKKRNGLGKLHGGKFQLIEDDIYGNPRVRGIAAKAAKAFDRGRL